MIYRLLLVIICGLALFVAGCSYNPGPSDTVASKDIAPANGTSAADATADYTGYCGQEFADKKQLRDAAANQINFNPIKTNIASLVSLLDSESTTRLPDEEKVYTINVNLDAMKAESDSDIHVGVSDGQGHTMIVEFIAPQCDVGLPHAAEIAQARADLFAECGVATSTGFTSLKGMTATITGVGFFDKLHGQFDVAPNGVELHPVLAFSGCGHPAPPPVTSTISTTTNNTTTVATTTTNPNNVGAGCKKYPGRHWYQHVYHVYCKSYYYTTE